MQDAAVSITFTPTFRQRYEVATVMSVQGPISILLSWFIPATGLLLLVIVLWDQTALSLSSSAVIAGSFLYLPLAIGIETFAQHRDFGRDDLTITVSDHGISTDRKDVSISHGWDEIKKVKKTFGFLLFFIGGRNAYFLPLETMSPKQIEAVASFAKKRGVRVAGV